MNFKKYQTFSEYLKKLDLDLNEVTQYLKILWEEEQNDNT